MEAAALGSKGRAADDTTRYGSVDRLVNAARQRVHRSNPVPGSRRAASPKPLSIGQPPPNSHQRGGERRPGANGLLSRSSAPQGSFHRRPMAAAQFAIGSTCAHGLARLRLGMRTMRIFRDAPIGQFRCRPRILFVCTANICRSPMAEACCKASCVERFPRDRFGGTRAIAVIHGRPHPMALAVTKRRPLQTSPTPSPARWSRISSPST